MGSPWRLRISNAQLNVAAKVTEGFSVEVQEQRSSSTYIENQNLEIQDLILRNAPPNRHLASPVCEIPAWISERWHCTFLQNGDIIGEMRPSKTPTLMAGHSHLPYPATHKDEALLAIFSSPPRLSPTPSSNTHRSTRAGNDRHGVYPLGEEESVYAMLACDTFAYGVHVPARKNRILDQSLLP
ncbi:hypothetical protein ACRALDRAFT_2016415 [Sodiomyces alcalophilus JCM 7366]|uniref:uncharacterized protein n=1 Tax=Sodiomyces alcalophilus JCM 7366 TaxID=591952 RepID=UPI0039B4CB08